MECDLQPQCTLLAQPEGLLLFVRCLSPPPLKYLCPTFLPSSFTSSPLLSLPFLPSKISGLEWNHFLSCVLLSHTFLCVVGYIPPSAWAASSLGYDSGLCVVLKTRTGISEVFQGSPSCWQPLHFSRAGRMNVYLPAFVTISSVKVCS